MPMVGDKKFPYTAKGKKMAKMEEKRMAKKAPVKKMAKKAVAKKMGKKK
jgi:hypothetical protein